MVLFWIALIPPGTENASSTPLSIFDTPTPMSPIPTPRRRSLKGLSLCVVSLGMLGLSSNPLAEPLAIKAVADGVYVHQGRHLLPNPENHGEIANIGFIVGNHCVAVIDTGGSQAQGESLKAAVKATTEVPVCYVINTHVHPDHIEGNRAFKLPGVKFVGHYRLAAAMAQRAPYYINQARDLLGLTLGPDDFIPPDVEVRESLDLDLGGRKLHLVAYPTAHTDNDLSVFESQSKTLWLGDLLFMGHLPVIDGSLLGWLKVITQLQSIPADRVVPGHGPITALWPLALTGEKRYLEGLAEDIRAALKANKTIEQAMNEIGHRQRADWQLFDDFHQRNIASGFAELEWEDPSPEPAMKNPGRSDP